MTSRKEKISFDEAIAQSGANENIELAISVRVFYFLLLLGISSSIVIGARVLEIGIVNADTYSNRALSNVNREFPIHAPRGIITDRFGKPIVENQSIFSAFIKVSAMVKINETAEVVKSLSSALGISIDELINKLSSANLESGDDMLIKQDITREEAIKIQSLGLSSVYAESDYRRKYIDPAFSHIVGYVGLPNKLELAADKNLAPSDSVGKAGLESWYDKDLRGTNGKRITYKNATQKIDGIEELVPEKPGNGLKTTIDLDFQKYFYERLSYNARLRGQTGAVGIALNPQNGEVLSLVSLPSFDANKVGNYLASPNNPLFNRAVSGLYNPGSTIKPLHAVAALKEGIINDQIEIFSRGYIEVPNPYDPEHPSRFVDWREHGWVDVYSALARSSNVFFYAVGGGLPPSEAEILSGAERLNGVGIAKLNQYWKEFGLDSKTGIDLPAEADGYLPDAELKKQRTGQIWRIGDTYNVAIGQGDLSITPLELINYISAIATKGKVYRPHLNAESAQEVLMDLSELAPEFKKVEIGMEDSVYKPYGTSYSISDLALKIAAKTGSAQTNNNTKTNALFVGYGPTDAKNGPEIVILILIENAREGSLNAIPIAKEVLVWYYENRIVNSNK